ncbi:ABC transporter substrate-binding protein [Pseudarthrobacter sp. DSP2-3-2b1]|uniref:ABC transporter substrate-binding protein n=1 Tax=Pseudarthrobacter sp. DSP2-3-2b1 TaxID=2804661 RepID=UPI003CED2A4B
MKSTNYLSLASATLALAMGLTACGTDSGSNASDNKTLVISGNASEKSGLDAVIDEFKKANPGVEVNVNYDKDPAAIVRTQLAAGTAADVLYVFSGQSALSTGALAPDGYLTDLSNEAWAGKQPESSNMINDVDGKRYMAAILVNGIGAIYNDTTMMATKLVAPTTFPEVLQFCDDAKAQGKFAYAMGMADKFVGQMVPYALASTLVYGPTPDIDEKLKSGASKFAETAWVDAIEKTKEMQDRGCFSPSPVGTSYDSSLQQVAKGEALGVVMVNSAINGIQKSAPDAKLTFKALPATDTASATQMPVAYGGTYAINSKAKNPEMAKKFLDHLTTNTSADLYAEKVGSVPFHMDGSQVTATAGADITSITQFQNEDKTSVFPNVLWPNPKVQSNFLSGIQEVFGGAKTAAELAESLQAAYDTK